jgi:hypothetical protein
MRTTNAAKESIGTERLNDKNQILERAQKMLQNASYIVVIDAFPETLKMLQTAIHQLQERNAEGKIKVFVQTYSNADKIKTDDHTSLMIVPEGDQVLDKWKAQQLNIAVDGNEMLAALFSDDMENVIEATYSNSPYLSCVFYAGMLNEHQLLQIRHANEKDREKLIEQLMFLGNSAVPGLKRLFQYYNL